MKFKAPSKFIDIHLPDGSIRKVRVPEWLTRATLPPGFLDYVFGKVCPTLKSHRRVGMMGISTLRGFSGTIIYVKSNGLLYWGVRSGGDIVACGQFELDLPYWRETLAAALPRVRGQGLYAEVLITLRKATRRKLLSDATLSEANMLVWSAIGDIDEGGVRFKINPRRSHPRHSQFKQALQSKAALDVARSIIAMEAP